MKTSSKILLITFGLSLLLSLGAVIWVKYYFNVNTERGSGNVITRTYSPEPFNKIRISGGFHVTLNKGEQSKVEVAVDDNFQKYIKVSVRDSTLNITGVNIFKAFGTKINITHTGIDELQILAGVILESNDTLESRNFVLQSSAGTSSTIAGNFENFRCTMSAGTKISLSGSSRNADFRLSAGTDLEAAGFITDSCTISASAGSSAVLHVTGYFEAEADAGSSIIYHGSPQIGKQNTSSGSSIRKF